MSKTMCARCDMRAETQWRIDLEAEHEGSTERTEYPLCRECWDEMTERFAGPPPTGA